VLQARVRSATRATEQRRRLDSRRRDAQAKGGSDPMMYQTVNKAVRVLELFSCERPEWGVTEMAVALGFPKSNTFNLISTLANQGLLRRTNAGRYRLGWRLMHMSQVLLDTTGFRAEARRAMEQLVSRYGEVVHLAALESDQVIYVDKIENARAGQVLVTGIGTKLPAQSTSVGKVILADRAWDDVLRIFGGRGLPALTPNSITSLEELRIELEKIRVRGYAYDMEETAPGLCCVAAPIRDRSGEVVAAMSFSGPTYRLQRGEERLRMAIIGAARQVSESLGWFGADRELGRVARAN